jgi:hypothetical protein
MGIDVLRSELLDRIKNGDEQLIRVMYAVSEALQEPQQADEPTDSEDPVLG